MRKQLMSPRGLCISAAVAAVYTLVAYLLAPISFGPAQFRVSEALTLLPVLMPEAIPGLFVGCALANLLGGYGLIDVVFGSLTTLAAAVLTYRLRKNKWLAALPPVVLNGIVVGLILHFTANAPLFETMGYITLEQAGVCYLLGLPLLSAMKLVPFGRIKN